MTEPRFEPWPSILAPEYFDAVPWQPPPEGKGPTSFNLAVIIVYCRYQKGTVVFWGSSGLKIPVKINKDKYLSPNEL